MLHFPPIVRSLKESNVVENQAVIQAALKMKRETAPFRKKRKREKEKKKKKIVSLICQLYPSHKLQYTRISLGFIFSIVSPSFLSLTRAFFFLSFFFFFFFFLLSIRTKASPLCLLLTSILSLTPVVKDKTHIDFEI